MSCLLACLWTCQASQAEAVESPTAGYSIAQFESGLDDFWDLGPSVAGGVGLRLGKDTAFLATGRVVLALLGAAFWEVTVTARFSPVRTPRARFDLEPAIGLDKLAVEALMEMPCGEDGCPSASISFRLDARAVFQAPKAGVGPALRARLRYLQLGWDESERDRHFPEVLAGAAWEVPLTGGKGYVTWNVLGGVGGMGYGGRAIPSMRAVVTVVADRGWHSVAPRRPSASQVDRPTRPKP